MKCIKATHILILIIFISSLTAQQSQCDNGYCDQNTFCDVGLCCNNRCVDPSLPALKTQDKGQNCSSCSQCKENLCCEKGICQDACSTDKGQYKCGCQVDEDCAISYYSGSPFYCIQNQCLRAADHMDLCIDDRQCNASFPAGRLKCLDDPRTNQKRCMLGVKLNDECPHNGNRDDLCDPTADLEWSACINSTCTALPKEGEECKGTYIANYPCASPWLTCIKGVCANHFSVPLGGTCDGPTQCQLPLICNTTERGFTEWSYGSGICVVPSLGPRCRQGNSECERELQKCGCEGEVPVCLSKPVTNQCNSAYKALQLCASQSSCMPPFFSAFGWLTRRGADSCLQETCREQLTEFYCCYSCDGWSLKGLKCYQEPRVFDEPNCCAGDVTCWMNYETSLRQQSTYCANPGDPVIVIPPLADTPNADGSPSGIDWNALITTVGLVIGLALGGAFFGVYYWRKKAEYERIQSWADDNSNPNATPMQNIGISVGN